MTYATVTLGGRALTAAVAGAEVAAIRRLGTSPLAQAAALARRALGAEPDARVNLLDTGNGSYTAWL